MNDRASGVVMARRLPIGAEVVGPDTVSFRVWAPACKRVALVIERDHEQEQLDLSPEADGYFSVVRPNTPVGTLYSYRLDEAESLTPDPASRFQPRGHDGPSQVVDPSRYRWRDAEWRGAPRRGQVLYEMHIGTFTREGTWRAAAARLPALADVGVTALEVMPVGEFPGRYGWGYDIVHFFAPTHLYGDPDEMRAFVDAAHAAGIAVMLDVVYNHCATSGCFLSAYSPSYFSSKYKSDWGHAMNFDDEGSQPVREFCLANVEYWIREFHLDGFRFDATQNIDDASPKHILGEISARARHAAGKRAVLLVGENEPQRTELLDPVERDGRDLDALWNDDFHHTARVAATGRVEAYYSDYRGTPQELISTVKRGFLYQGQHYGWQKKRRGTPTFGYSPERFVHYLQNHDQIANSVRGLRLQALTSPGLYRALTALLLLSPQTPLIFQGQEFAASTPFVYFADNTPEQARLCKEGRADFLRQFPSIAAGGDRMLHDPADARSFEMSKLDWAERERNREAVALHRDLLRLRRSDAVFSAQDADALDGAVLGHSSFALRFFGDRGDDRLVVVNLGAQLALAPLPEPLLAPPRDREWTLLWSSEDVAYGGDGTPAPGCDANWELPAQSLLAFAAR